MARLATNATPQLWQWVGRHFAAGGCVGAAGGAFATVAAINARLKARHLAVYAMRAAFSRLGDTFPANRCLARLKRFLHRSPQKIRAAVPAVSFAPHGQNLAGSIVIFV